MTDTKSLQELADGALEMVEVDGDGCYFSGALVTELAAAIIALLDENAALTAQLDEYDLKNRILVKDFNTLTTENRALAAQNQRAEARIAALRKRLDSTETNLLVDVKTNPQLRGALWPYVGQIREAITLATDDAAAKDGEPKDA